MTETVTVRMGEAVAAGGDGVGRLADGKVVLVEGALPGELAEVDLVERHKDFARGRAVGILEASPGRVEPPCPERSAGCGGCGWGHVTPELQLALRARVVADSLARIGRLADAPAARVVRLPTSAFRTTLALAVDPEGRPAYRRARSHDLVAPGSCMVAHPRLEELVVGGRFPGAVSVTLRVGVAGGERLAVLDSAAGARRRVRSRPGARRPRGAAAAEAEVPADVVVVGAGRPAGTSGGAGGSGAVFHEAAGGRTWRVSARSFFQPGPAAADALVAEVDAALGGSIGPGDVLADLYAGVGLLGGSVAARRGARLVAVERSAVAAGDARHNLADLDAEVVAAEVGAWDARPAAAVVADPARPGLGRPGVAAAGGTGAGVLVLVSCDPASLGRDAGLLTSAGWRLESLAVLDVFPHTPHVECVSRFTRPRR